MLEVFKNEEFKAPCVLLQYFLMERKIKILFISLNLEKLKVFLEYFKTLFKKHFDRVDSAHNEQN